MSYEQIVIEVRDEQKLEFEGQEVARTKDSQFVVYETPKGNWVVVEKEIILKSVANHPKGKVQSLTGFDKSYEIIKGKDQKILFGRIGFGKQLDEICALLKISPTKKLDV